VALDGASVYAAASKLLDYVQAGLILNGVQPPERCFITPGLIVALDDEQLTVSLNEIGEGAAGAPEGVFAVPAMTQFHLSFNVMLVRKVASLSDSASIADLPLPSDLQASAIVTMTDSVAIVATMNQLKADYVFAPPNAQFIPKPTKSYGPDGGLAGSITEVGWNLT
jgi:hypothetical protein